MPCPPVAARQRHNGKIFGARLSSATELENAPEGTGLRLRAVYEHCQSAVERGRLPSLRRCLESKHDTMVGTLNNRYWRAIKTGS